MTLFDSGYFISIHLIGCIDPKQFLTVRLFVTAPGLEPMTPWTRGNCVQLLRSFSMLPFKLYFFSVCIIHITFLRYLSCSCITSECESKTLDSVSFIFVGRKSVKAQILFQANIFDNHRIKDVWASVCNFWKILSNLKSPNRSSSVSTVSIFLWALVSPNFTSLSHHFECLRIAPTYTYFDTNSQCGKGKGKILNQMTPKIRFSRSIVCTVCLSLSPNHLL